MMTLTSDCGNVPLRDPAIDTVRSRLGRVCVVTPLYPPHSLGGTQLRAYKLAHWLAAQGFEVEIICVEQIQPGQVDRVVRVESEPHDGVQVNRLYLEHTASATGFRYQYDHPGIKGYLEDFVARNRPDLVHLISGYLITPAIIEVAYAHQIPVVVTITDYWFVCPRINLIRSNQQPCGGPYSALDCTRCLLSESRRYRLPERFFPAAANLIWRALAHRGANRIPLYPEVTRRMDYLPTLLNQADAITIPTNSLRSRLVAAGVQDRFILSRHGLALAELGIRTDQPKSASSVFRFGFLGTVIHNKGVDLLVEAYARLVAEHPTVSLEIWGDATIQPEYVRPLQKRLSALPRAALRGRYLPQQLGQIMHNIDALVVPSRWPEIGPFVVLEAFATHTPVIATRLGNMLELVDHDRSGLLFEPNSIDDLYAQMRRLVTEPTLYERLQTNIPPVRTHADEMHDILQVYAAVMQADSR